MYWRFIDKAKGYRGPVIYVAYPHTSRWDAIVARAAAVAFRDPPLLLVQACEFVGLRGRLLRWAGGFPVPAAQGIGTVDVVIARMALAPQKSLAISSEGALAATPWWRTGYYVLGMATGLPVSYCWYDYPRRTMTREYPVELTGDPARDLEVARRLLRPGVGLYPDQVGPIQFKPGWTLDWDRLERQRAFWRSEMQRYGSPSLPQPHRQSP